MIDNTEIIKKTGALEYLTDKDLEMLKKTVEDLDLLFAEF